MSSSSVIIPLVKTISHVVAKDVFLSKKYRLALNLLMWATVCWRSIPDCNDFLYNCIRRHHDKKQYDAVKRTAYFFVDYMWMGAAFFARLLAMIIIMKRGRIPPRPPRVNKNLVDTDFLE